MPSIFKFNSTRIPELDGIRGFALLLIIVFHYVNNQIILTENPSNFIIHLSKITSFTGTVLDLFFILSGYLIGSILLKNKRRKNYFRVFYMRRILRIIPIFFLLLFVYLGLERLNINDPDGFLFANQLPIWTYFAFVQNYMMAIYNTYGARILTPTWSLGVEEQFYILLPAAIFFIRKRFLPYLFVILIVAAPIFRYFTSSMYMEYLPFQMRMDSLFLGALLAYWLDKEGFKEQISKNLNFLYLSLFTLLVLAVGLSYTNRIGVLYHSFFNLIYALLILCSLCKRSFFSTFFKHKTLRFFGLISYGTYIFHQLISGVLHAQILNSKPKLSSWTELSITGLSFIVTIILAYIIYRFIEKPLISFGHRFKYN